MHFNQIMLNSLKIFKYKIKFNQIFFQEGLFARIFNSIVMIIF